MPSIFPLGGAGLTGGSVALAAFVDPIAGGALFGGGLVGAFIWEISSNDPNRRQPFREAAAEGRRDAPSTPRRVLVVANRTLQTSPRSAGTVSSRSLSRMSVTSR